MTQFLVHLRELPTVATPKKRRVLRRTADEIAGETAALRQRLDACARRIQDIVPEADVQPLTHLGAVVVVLHSPADVVDIQRRIRAACAEVEGFTTDVPIEQVSPSSARR